MALWIQLFLGIWILLSPWLLGFSGISIMMWSNLLGGLGLVLAAVWRIFDVPGTVQDKKVVN